MKYDEEELNRAIEKGTKAWADVPDISEWVAEQRGRTGMTIGHEHMMVYAARYAHGRQTGAALQVINHILSEWDKLTENTKRKLYDESREARYCQEDWQKLRDKYEEEHQCCNCVYEIYQGSMPSCAMDMRHGKACRFFELRKIN